jgi:hypothetical protein
MESIQLAQMLADLSDINAAVGYDTILYDTLSNCIYAIIKQIDSKGHASSVLICVAGFP